MKLSFLESVIGGLIVKLLNQENRQKYEVVFTDLVFDLLLSLDHDVSSDNNNSR